MGLALAVTGGLVFIALLLWGGLAEVSDKDRDEECELMATEIPLDCSWFLYCLERRTPCGEKGIAKAFGHPYCARTLGNLEKFSSVGQSFLKLSCSDVVQEFADSEVYEGRGSCDQIEKELLRLFTVAFEENDFCEAILTNTTDLQAFLEIIHSFTEQKSIKFVHKLYSIMLQGLAQCLNEERENVHSCTLFCESKPKNLKLQL